MVADLQDELKEQGRVPLYIQLASLFYPVRKYKDSENEAKGEVIKFHFTPRDKNKYGLGKQVVGSVYDNGGKEYSAIWICLGNDWFKLVSKVRSYWNCQ